MKRIAVGQHVVAWVASKTNEYGNFGAAQGIGLQELQQPNQKGKPVWALIAGVAYAEWNGVNVVCHIASDKTRRWLNREYLWTIFDYPFNQLGVKRITVCVGEGNTASRRFVVKLGFVPEATLAGAHPTGDLLMFVLWRQNCRWLNLRGSENEKMAA